LGGRRSHRCHKYTKVDAAEAVEAVEAGKAMKISLSQKVAEIGSPWKSQRSQIPK
jgi:hypothetical protein